jgi:type II secretory pathway pseudopilin PulG
MTLLIPDRIRKHRKRRPFFRGFTLPEVLLTMTICVLITIAVVTSQMFGARLTQFTQAKVNTSDNARSLMRLLNSDIQSARLVRVGQGNSSSFTEALIDTPQQGNALEIYPTTSSNVFLRYFRNASDSKLKRLATNGVVADLASNITNLSVFSAEDFRGNVVTTRQHNAVIGIDLQFNRLTNPNLPLGPGQHYKSYRFQTRIAPPML